MFLSMLSVAATISSVSSSTSWNYEHDGSDWGAIGSCGAQFSTQSPINIPSTTANSCPDDIDNIDWSLAEIDDIDHYEIKNTGHSLQIIPVAKDSSDGSKLGVLKNKFAIENSKHDEEHWLHSIHFHWGSTDITGTEHRIDGKQGALEMHFVHHSKTYDTLDAAIAASTLDDKALSVVGVMYYVEDGKDTEFLSKIIAEASNIESSTSNQHIVPDAHAYTMNELVSANKELTGEFYAYKGALTTPDCNAVVQWHVIKEPMYISSSSMATLRSALKDAEGNPMEKNCRTTQTNSNSVYLCGKNDDSDDADDR